MLRVALVALLLLPAPAMAQWETVAVAPEGRPPALVFSDDGRALLAFQRGGALRLASWRPGTAPVPGARLTGALLGEPRRIGAHRALLALVSGPPERQRLSAAVASISGRVLETPRRIRPYRFAYASATAVSAKGEAAVAWVEQHGSGRLRLRLAIRPRSGKFGRSRVIADLGADSHPGPAAVAAAYSGSRLVLAFTLQRADGRRQVHALIGRRRQVLGKHLGIADMSAAANRAGRVVVGWQTQDGGEEGNEPAEVRAALLEPGGARFRRTQLLDPGDGIGRWPGQIRAAVAAGGEAALTWSQMARPGTFPVALATAAPAGRFAPEQIVDPNGAAGGVAFAADGRALVTWGRITRENYQQPDQVFAAQRQAGVLGPAEPVSEDVGVWPPLAAADPRSGRFVVAWGSFPRYPSNDPMVPFISLRAR
jgi:hypothetical protein